MSSKMGSKMGSRMGALQDITSMAGLRAFAASLPCPASPSRHLQRPGCAFLQLELASKHNPAFLFLSSSPSPSPRPFSEAICNIVAQGPPGRTTDGRRLW